MTKKETKMAEKEIKMVEIELDLDNDLYQKLLVLSKEEIVKDENALLNYIINESLEHAMQHKKDFAKLVKGTKNERNSH